jgi:hypothetical protein
MTAQITDVARTAQTVVVGQAALQTAEAQIASGARRSVTAAPLNKLQTAGGISDS